MVKRLRAQGGDLVSGSTWLVRNQDKSQTRKYLAGSKSQLGLGGLANS